MNKPCERVANGRMTVNINDTFGTSNYLKAADLKGRSVKLVIESVTTEKVGDDDKAVVHFAGKEKGLVLNKTNAMRIVEATGTDETDEWEGWTITLYACKVDFQGKRVDGLRVDDRPGATKRPLGQTQRPTASRAAADEPPPELNDDDIVF